MTPEKRHLVHDLLTHGETGPRREAILSVGRRILRHKRRRRMSLRCLAILAGLALAFLGAEQMMTPHPLEPAARKVVAPALVTPFRVHFLSDEELLKLFADTPVALAQVNHKKQLIFPRTSDQERFVTRFSEAKWRE